MKEKLIKEIIEVLNSDKPRFDSVVNINLEDFIDRPNEIVALREECDGSYTLLYDDEEEMSLTQCSEVLVRKIAAYLARFYE